MGEGEGVEEVTENPTRESAFTFRVWSGITNKMLYDGHDLAEARERAGREAPFLAGLLRRFPDISPADAAGLTAVPGNADMAMVRTARSKLALAVALGDLTGQFDLSAVVGTLSDFADAAIRWAVATAFLERTGGPPTGWATIALGKLGSRELNYSSDVDLIHLFDGDRLARRDDEDPAEAANRIARRVTELLQMRTKEGYVARVDLRLRPDAESFALATSLRRAEIYYQSEAQTWERAAMIRARFVAGDEQLADSFLAMIGKFVWRRSLDFTAIKAIEDVSLRIREASDGAETFGPGFDLKRGRGGIREIEFFAQSHQMIFGGRDPSLRTGQTVPALEALAAAEFIPSDDAEKLADTYRALRTAEHRAQMMNDEQTHAVPARKPEREAFARLCGAKDFAALSAQLKPQVDRAAEVYDAHVSAADQPAVPRGKALSAWIEKEALPAPREFASLITNWRSRPYAALRSDAAQIELESALPVLVEAFGSLSTPHNALRRLDDALSRMSSAVRFLALVAANPGLALLLARAMGHAPSLANSVGRRPELLDVLLGADLAEKAGRENLTAQLIRQLARFDDLEAKLDAVRRFASEQKFRIGVSLIEGLLDPLEGARAYADVADAVITAMLPPVRAELAQRYEQPPETYPVVLALGRYGGRQLTAASDLDLVFLFAGPHDSRTPGDDGIGATNYYNRLFQRFSSALSVPTAAGPLFEVDTRLRPSGAQGLLAVSISAFREYQSSNAWTWEHMALTRARAVLDESDGAAIAEAIRETLTRKRDPAKLRRDVAKMRAEMDKAKPQGGRLDVKNGRGGLVDLEFVVQFLQLRDGDCLTPYLREAVIALIENGKLPGDILSAHDLLTRALILYRLVGDEADGRNSARTRALIAERCGCDGWPAFLTGVSDARRLIGNEFKRYLEGKET